MRSNSARLLASPSAVRAKSTNSAWMSCDGTAVPMRFSQARVTVDCSCRTPCELTRPSPNSFPVGGDGHRMCHRASPMSMSLVKAARTGGVTWPGSADRSCATSSTAIEIGAMNTTRIGATIFAPSATRGSARSCSTMQRSKCRRSTSRFPWQNSTGTSICHRQTPTIDYGSTFPGFMIPSGSSAVLDPPHHARAPRRRASPASCMASACRSHARPRNCRLARAPPRSPCP